jgi:hypothetical protein
MRAAVFAGPSLAAPGAAPLDVPEPIELLPPVKRGDIARLLDSADPPTHLGIIDGEFLQGLMVSPKEVLRAMDVSGVRVYGSSSVGALRAAELAGYGMVGIGSVFELYRSGAIDGDDEVAVTYDQTTGGALCEPMVNLRVAIAAAVDGGVITRESADEALRIAKALYFPDRTHARLIKELAGRGRDEDADRLAAFLRDEAPSAKRDDAAALLAAMAADIGSLASTSEGPTAGEKG